MISFESLPVFLLYTLPKPANQCFFQHFLKQVFFKHHHLPFREPALFSELFLEKIIVVRIWSE